MDVNKKKQALRARRHRRIRRRVSGTPERPRLCVYRSNKYVYAQVIDDLNGCTLAAASSRSGDVAEAGSGTTVGSAVVGDLVARKCLEKGIQKVVFDRAGYRYHGRVKALAEAARKRFKEENAEGF